MRLKPLEEQTIVITGGSSGTGELYGNPRDSVRRTSIFTTFSMHPKTTVAAAAGAGLAGVAVASWLLKASPGDRKSADRLDEADFGEQPRADDIVASARERRMELTK